MNETEQVDSRPQTFPKSAKLRHRTLLAALFEKGATLYCYPLRGQWRALSGEELRDSFRDVVPEGIGPVQVMVSVPKRKRRHAVDRVRMRRLIKESFRRRRRALADIIEEHPEWRTLSLGLVYIADKNLDFRTVDKKLGVLLHKLKEELKK